MIEVSGLTKRYGSHIAVDNLSFTIEKGHIYGFLGPNGAGKSTTMNIITGCLAATEGEVRIGGFDIFNEAEKAKRLIGYLPEQPPLYLDMSPDEYLSFVARAKGLKQEEAKRQLEQVKTLTGINEVSGRLIKNLSKGYRQRVGIAQALLGDPELIILDEPTVGLDPKQITEIRDLIKSLGENHTVILSSHILSEVRAVCDEIMIISKGRLKAVDTPENLEKLFAGQSAVEIVVKAGPEEAKYALTKIEAVTELVCEDIGEGKTRATISAEDTSELCEAVFFAFCEIKKPILKMNVVGASLEDVFLELTKTEEAGEHVGSPLQKGKEAGEHVGSPLQKDKGAGEHVGSPLQKGKEAGEHVGSPLQKGKEAGEHVDVSEEEDKNI
jgi:ABC-2 type transport system ATP-binding protein